MAVVSDALARDLGGIATLTLENAGAGGLARGITTFGQVFKQGDLPAGGTLLARIGNTTVPAQIDVKTTWPDGSAKMAVITLERPALAAGEKSQVVLVPSTTPEGPALDLATALTGREFTVTLTPQGKAPVTIDVLDALRDALADGSASFWQHGPLATQARVEVLIPGTSQRMVFDVTAYKGGGLEVDAQFNNDRAMEAVGGRANYTLTVTMDGKQVASETVSQGQYQNWHREFSSSAVDGGQGLGSPSSGWLNIRHDVEHLESLGVVPHYDLTLSVPESLLNSYAAAIQSTSWDKPLSNNGVTQYMPMTGGRPDIGFTTQANAAWLISGDPRAAAYALGQAEAAGAVPWNFYDAKNGTWLNTDNYPRIWTDPRGGTGRAGDPNSTGLTQQVDGSTGWSPDTAHQPNLSFVPYVLTGERWILDNLQAQAAFNIVGLWPAVRQNADDILAQGVQVRGAAWALRELENAAWASPDGSAEQAYFRSAADANWKWLVSKIPEWTAMQGEAHGWLPGEYGTKGALPPWQQDFFASTVIAAAARGNEDALTFLNWQKNFLIGRFEQTDFDFQDGAAYLIAISDANTGRVFKTWAEIEAQTDARGWGYEKLGWADGYYGQLALATLAGIYHLTGDTRAYNAYMKLVDANPASTGRDDFAKLTSYAVTIPGEYGWGFGNDTISPHNPVNGRIYDLSWGYDKLVLADGGNVVEVRNTETIIGGSGSDAVTVSAVTAASYIDLGGGSDSLILPNQWNSATVLNTEKIVGGSQPDWVTLGTPAAGTVVDLGAGTDQLTLSDAAPNRITVRNTESIIGGAADDSVTLDSNAVSGTSVDLRGGNDRLTLAATGNNTISVSNVETVIGGAGIDTVNVFTPAPMTITLSNVEIVVGSWTADSVAFATPVVGGSVDLRDAADRLTLSGAGPNRLTVSNVETITGGAAADDVTLGSFVWGASIDLGGGADRLTLNKSTANIVSVQNVETVIGGDSNDTVTFRTPALNAFVDLGAGKDTLVLPSTGPNRLTVRNVETITGGTKYDVIIMQGNGSGTPTPPPGKTPPPASSGFAVAGVSASAADAAPEPAPAPLTLDVHDVERIRGTDGADVVTFWTSVQDGLVSLLDGDDKLVLAAGGSNKVTVRGVETVVGGGGADTVTVEAVSRTGITIDLGGNADKVVFATGTAKVTASLSNVETILGGAAAETIRLATGASMVDLGAGNDRLELANVANVITVSNVETVIGNAQADRITVSGSQATMLQGNDGHDSLTGGAGADTLLGGAGRDVMTGGAGADRFVFSAAADSPLAAPDIITDFDPTADLLVFAAPLLHGSFAYRGTAAFTATGNTEARFAPGSPVLQIDLDGNGTADMAVQLTGVSPAALGASDFVWS